MVWVKLGILIVLIIVLIYLSRRVLAQTPHGFYRLFAFISILILIFLNSDSWFANPFSIQQLFSWLLLLTSIFLVIHGLTLLKQIGQPNGNFENTTHLVISGAYHFIRHPLYASLLALTWGAGLKAITIPSLCLSLVATVFLYATARVEEQENLMRFGAEYQEYMRKTKLFIPFIW
jgi:protein-S-isoprenylcysteine O-methyltransferase Ste14